MTDKNIVWVLCDDRAGNVSQVLGVAEALLLPYERKNIIYNKLARLPNFINSYFLIGLTDDSKKEISGNVFPDIIISAGRKTAAIAAYIKRKSAGKTKIVQIMRPGICPKIFDMIVLPEHDKFKDLQNIVRIVGAPNKINKKLLDEQKEKWQPIFNYLPSPKIAVLIGGSTKKGIFTTEHARDISIKASQLLSGKKGSFLITTSRRTSEEATKVIKSSISAQFYFHDFYSTKENPYLGYLAVSDYIIVTGDSISMMSEACSTGKPVFIYSPKDIIPEKHQKFQKVLFEKNYAKPLTGNFSDWKYTPLSDADFVANLIKEKFLV